VLWATVCAAAGPPTVTARIAAVPLQFEHVCTPAQRQVLEEISRAADTPAAGRTLALAVMRVLHTPNPDDVVSLERVTADPTTITHELPPFAREPPSISQWRGGPQRN
jgi:hypothetical protein